MSRKYDKDATYRVDGRVENFSYVGHDNNEVCLRVKESGKLFMSDHSHVTKAPDSIDDILDNILSSRQYGSTRGERKWFRSKLQVMKSDLRDSGINIVLLRGGGAEQVDFDPKIISK